MKSSKSKSKITTVSILSVVILLSLVIISKQSHILNIDLSTLLAGAEDSSYRKVNVLDADNDMIRWDDIVSDKIDRGTSCLNQMYKNYPSYRELQKRSLSSWTIKRDITDLFNDGSLSAGSQAHAKVMVDMLTESLQALKEGRVSGATNYVIILKPTLVESKQSYESVTSLRYACLSSPSESESISTLVGEIRNKSGKHLSDDPNGSKKIDQLVSLWNTFIKQDGSLGFFDIARAYTLSDDFDIIIPVHGQRLDNSIVLSLSIDSKCFNIDDSSNQELTRSGRCAANSADMQNILNSIEGKITKKISYYKDKETTYKTITEKILREIDVKVANLRQN